MRTILVLGILLALGGCQTISLGKPTQGDVLGRLETALPGEYDNHEQVQAGAGASAAAAVPHLHETWKRLDDGFWLWRMRTLDAPSGAEAIWLFRLSGADARVKLMPDRKSVV